MNEDHGFYRAMLLIVLGSIGLVGFMWLLDYALETIGAA